MIKVCLVVNSLLFGGVEKVIENYLKEFNPNEFEFTIVTQDNASKECIKYFESLGFKVLVVVHKKKNFIRNTYEINRIIKNSNFDIVHSHMSRTNFYVLKIAKQCGVRVRINHYHNVFEGNPVKILVIKYLNKLCDKYATDNIFCSEAVKAFFGKCNKPGFVLHNAIDLKKFKYDKQSRKNVREIYGITDEEVVLGHIGRFTDQKNHSFLIDVFYEFYKNNPKSKLLLVGEGPLEDTIRRKVEKLSLASSVIFVGSTTEANKFYQAMDYFIFPSLWEGLSLTFLEAQISGLPCIGSDILPDEGVVSSNVIRLSLSDGPSEWSKRITMPDIDRENIYDNRMDKYNLEKRKNKLFDFYKRRIEKVQKSASGNREYGE